MASSSKSGEGRTAVRTTIVGGQPPGNARSLAEVPIGLERLLGLAAVDDRLAAELARDPVALAEGCGIVLEPTELTVLTATPPGGLLRMLDGLRAGLAEPARREFMKRAAVAVTALLAVSGAAAAGCKKTTPESGSNATSKPADMEPPPQGMVAKPDASAPARKPPPYVDQVKRGVSPRRPRPKQPTGTRTGIRPK